MSIIDPLSDLLGRCWVALMGAGFLVLRMIVASTATNMNNFMGVSPLLLKYNNFRN
jgi:hypothetical protein